MATESERVPVSTEIKEPGERVSAPRQSAGSPSAMRAAQAPRRLSGRGAVCRGPLTDPGAPACGTGTGQALAGASMLRLMQSALARLPLRTQSAVRRFNYSRQIRRGTFVPDDAVTREITRHLHEGDWAVDVGANVGRYTLHMAQLVGVTGRVIAFEPVPVSFALLAVNVHIAGFRNVSLFNVALSSAAGVSGMTVPSYERTNLKNFYEASLDGLGEYPVLCLPLQGIPIPRAVTLIKIDTEGHDLHVLIGLQCVLNRDKPVLIVESRLGGAPASWLRGRGYTIHKVEDSSNIVAHSTQSVIDKTV